MIQCRRKRLPNFKGKTQFSDAWLLCPTPGISLESGFVDFSLPEGHMMGSWRQHCLKSCLMGAGYADPNPTE